MAPSFFISRNASWTPSSRTDRAPADNRSLTDGTTGRGAAGRLRSSISVSIHRVRSAPWSEVVPSPRPWLEQRRTTRAQHPARTEQRCGSSDGRRCPEGDRGLLTRLADRAFEGTRVRASMGRSAAVSPRLREGREALELRLSSCCHRYAHLRRNMPTPRCCVSNRPPSISRPGASENAA